ncbi:alanine--tRNA ligase [Candidatus Falkowbacteria bacterium]|nr:alanine--tRNA ligase [Candidatus Falkowbacteria bacterium]
MITSSELREKFNKFFAQKKHAIIQSASLIPENDPSVLFTTAGMHPLVPFLLGEKHPPGNRLVGIQKCVRTGDIDEVGDNRHLTFFEMLGNWSLGDYFKKEAIEWSFEFLTAKKWLGLNPERLYVTVFRGDENAPLDEETIRHWTEQFKSVKIDAKVSLKGEWENENIRIFALDRNENWWGLASGGPCGPCTEIFYDTRPEAGWEKGKSHARLVEEGRLVEIWNDVFMEYEYVNQNDQILKQGFEKFKCHPEALEGRHLTVMLRESFDKLRINSQHDIEAQPDIVQDDRRRYRKLAQKNVDTGMGLERTLSILNGQKEVFDIEEFQILFDKIAELSGRKYVDNKREFRIIADHLRAVTFILGDEKGIEPSNVKQGYILRRLIRRAVRYGRQLGISGVFTFKIAEKVVDAMKNIYPELKKNKDFIVNQLVKEEEKFNETLERGLKEVNKLVAVGRGAERIAFGKDPKAVNRVDAEKAFYIFQSFGFPLEMIQEELGKRGLLVDEKEFNAEFRKHQELSRTASAGMFKGGLADSSDEVKRLHTAAHLMLEALRRVLGPHVEQKGSNITAERLRFDFSHPQKMTAEEIKKVEDIVNEQIKKNLAARFVEMSVDEAKALGATGVFEHKYGEKVKVYFVGNEGDYFSKEICGGPHVNNTGELGHFRIIKEEASSAGVRRIKAVLEKGTRNA